MLEKEWKHFKSGTDIRGIGSLGSGEPIDLTDEVVAKMAIGFAKWISKRYVNNTRIAVGRDSRLSGPRISSSVIKALSNIGFDVYDCGLSSTPSMFMTTVMADCVGAIQITASHHPFYRNGLKFFCTEGGLDAPDIEEILTYAQELTQSDLEKEVNPKGEVKQFDFMKQYSAHLRNIIKKGVNSDDYHYPLKGKKIVVDAGNGAGGFYAYDVLEPLGADITGSQFLEPDGNFPNHIPNPEDKVAMEYICNATVKNKADLGVIFDTDVDRAGCVDKFGNEINRNTLVALASVIALEDNEGGTIVTDSITSDGLKKFIEQNLGGKHFRFKRGYKNVINKAIELNNNGINSPLAIETSGHAALKENYFLDDGAYLITRIIIKMAKLSKQNSSIEELIAPLEKAVEEKEIRFNILNENFKEYGQSVILKVEEFAKQKGLKVADDSHEGIRVSFDKDNGDGWFLLRLSVHDPIMPLNIESNSEGGVQKIINILKECLMQFEKLDTSNLK